MEINKLYKIEKCTKTTLLNLIINEIANGVKHVNIYNGPNCIKSAQIGSENSDSFESVINYLYYQHTKNKCKILCHKIEYQDRKGTIALWFEI